jgi:FRG domain
MTRTTRVTKIMSFRNVTIFLLQGRQVILTHDMNEIDDIAKAEERTLASQLETTAPVDPFLKEVREAVVKLRRKELRVWYRGVSCNKYKLLPTLLRKNLKKELRTREKNLFCRFQVQAGELLPPGLKSPWEILSAMQHYRVPTRMMDWTESLFVALYFALEFEDQEDEAENREKEEKKIRRNFLRAFGS